MIKELLVKNASTLLGDRRGRTKKLALIISDVYEKVEQA
jgi:hypothetical protein